MSEEDSVSNVVEEGMDGWEIGRNGRIRSACRRVSLLYGKSLAEGISDSELSTRYNCDLILENIGFFNCRREAH